MQTTLDTFFKPKDTAPEPKGQKRQRPREEEEEGEGSSSLSLAEKKKIDENRLNALHKKYSDAQAFYMHMEEFIPSSWRQALDGGAGRSKKFYDFKSTDFKNLTAFLVAESKSKIVYPPTSQVFSALSACPYEETRVVILGQDPYHNPGQAHGMAFSVSVGVPPPPSLVNIYKELANDIAGFSRPTHGYLMKWATQGVLLLNTSLTVRKNEANSHAKKGWEKLTDAIISSVSALPRPVVFLLWGSPAKAKMKLIDTGRHKVLTTVHPSPLSAHRGFFGCKCFSQCNAFLVNAHQEPIDWSAIMRID